MLCYVMLIFVRKQNRSTQPGRNHAAARAWESFKSKTHTHEKDGHTARLQRFVTAAAYSTKLEAAPRAVKYPGGFVGGDAIKLVQRALSQPAPRGPTR